MPCIIGFTGRHNSGKTTVIRKIIPELKARGYRVGVLKSTHHSVSFNQPGKDTTLYRQEGVETVALCGPEEIALFQNRQDEGLERTIFRLFPDEDVIILEGFKNEQGIPRIEVAVESSPELYNEINGVKAVITREAVQGRKVLDPDDPAALTDFIEKEIISPYQKEDEISIFINNRKLPLKLFVKNAVKGLITGFLKSLKFTEGAKKIDIRIVLR